MEVQRFKAKIQNIDRPAKRSVHAIMYSEHNGTTQIEGGYNDVRIDKIYLQWVLIIVT